VDFREIWRFDVLETQEELVKFWEKNPEYILDNLS